jgi:hypothetical protein
MGLQADIKWIQNELQYVTDPRLISALKSLLLLQKNDSKEPFTPEAYLTEILEAESEIKNGEFISLEEFEKKSAKWD